MMRKFSQNKSKNIQIQKKDNSFTNSWRNFQESIETQKNYKWDIEFI